MVVQRSNNRPSILGCQTQFLSQDFSIGQHYKLRHLPPSHSSQSEYHCCHRKGHAIIKVRRPALWHKNPRKISSHQARKSFFSVILPYTRYTFFLCDIFLLIFCARLCEGRSVWKLHKCMYCNSASQRTCPRSAGKLPALQQKASPVFENIPYSATSSPKYPA